MVTPHRWSGWPGAWCLDCGINDPYEYCLAGNHPECRAVPDKNGYPDVSKCSLHGEVPSCSEPGSNRNNPYTREEIR